MALFEKFLKTKRERFLFYATIGVVVGSILLLNVVFPAIEKWTTLSDKLDKKIAELNKVNSLIKNENQIEKDYAEIQKGIKLTDPKKHAEDTLLLQADDIAKEIGIHFTRLDQVLVHKVPKLPNYQAYSLQVQFEGDLLLVGKFLHGMQERGLYIDYFLLVPKNKAAHNPTLQATIRMGKLVSKEAETKK